MLSPYIHIVTSLFKVSNLNASTNLGLLAILTLVPPCEFKRTVYFAYPNYQ